MVLLLRQSFFLSFVFVLKFPQSLTKHMVDTNLDCF